uniref:Uncharacterized protein n=1 Tax=Parascaris equorum TaxID=6256 RepID=A0A914RLJ7_PAREQ
MEEAERLLEQSLQRREQPETESDVKGDQMEAEEMLRKSMLTLNGVENGIDRVEMLTSSSKAPEVVTGGNSQLSAITASRSSVARTTTMRTTTLSITPGTPPLLLLKAVEKTKESAAPMKVNVIYV